MTSDAQQHYERWPAAMAGVKRAAPEVAQGFGALFQKTMGEGALGVREKELLALAIGLALRCERCVYAHAEKAVHAGATREQLLETAGVVVMMQGGPGYVQMPVLLEAMEALGV